MILFFFTGFSYLFNPRQTVTSMFPHHVNSWHSCCCLSALAPKVAKTALQKAKHGHKCFVKCVIFPPQNWSNYKTEVFLTANLPLSLFFLSGPFRDCLAAQEAGHSTSGMYLIRPDEAERPVQVWCEQDIDNGGWTVIQSRRDGSVNFFRNWDNYKVMTMTLPLLCQSYFSHSPPEPTRIFGLTRDNKGAVIWPIYGNHLGSLGPFPGPESLCFHLL